MRALVQHDENTSYVYEVEEVKIIDDRKGHGVVQLKLTNKDCVILETDDGTEVFSVGVSLASKGFYNFSEWTFKGVISI